MSHSWQECWSLSWTCWDSRCITWCKWSGRTSLTINHWNDRFEREVMFLMNRDHQRWRHIFVEIFRNRKRNRKSNSKTTTNFVSSPDGSFFVVEMGFWKFCFYSEVHCTRSPTWKTGIQFGNSFVSNKFRHLQQEPGHSGDSSGDCDFPNRHSQGASWLTYCTYVMTRIPTFDTNVVIYW